jgi:hypothetical protein
VRDEGFAPWSVGYGEMIEGVETQQPCVEINHYCREEGAEDIHTIAHNWLQDVLCTCGEECQREPAG